MTVFAVDANAAEAALETGQFFFLRDGSTAAALTVNYSLSGTAVAGSDFTALAGSVTIPVGTSSATVTLAPLNDALDEASETVVVTLNNDPSYTVGVPGGKATVTIADDDPTPSLTINNVSQAEGNVGQSNIARFTVTLTPVSGQQVSVNFATANGTATAGSDYVSQSGTLTIPAGQTTGTIDITLVGDNLGGPNETFLLNLTNPTNATIADSQGLGTITSDDALPMVRFRAPTTTSGSEATPSATLVIELTAPSEAQVIVGVTPVAGPGAGTATPNVDYMLPPGNVTIPPGQVQATKMLNIVNDTISEPDETAILQLGPVTGATISATQNRHTYTILNDDGPLPLVTISSSDVTAQEHEDPPSINSATFTITRTGSTASALVVNFTKTGSAFVGMDYTDFGNSATIPAGMTSVTVTVTPMDDTIEEQFETVRITLSTSPSNYSIAPPGEVTLFIHDNDVRVSIVATDNMAKEASPGLTGIFEVRRTGPTTAALTVGYTVTGSATNGADYQTLSGSVTILAGSDFRQIVVTPMTDLLVERTENVRLLLNNGLGYRVNTTMGSAEVFIGDNDTIVDIEASDANAAEAGLDPGQFRITRSGGVEASAEDLMITLQITGSATGGMDYTALSTSVTIPAGMISITLPVTPLHDVEPELPETVIVTVAESDCYTRSSRTQAMVFIADNEAPVITVAFTDPEGQENPLVTNPGIFTFTRLGDTSAAITVNYTVGGSATPDKDYFALFGTVTIPAGASTARVFVLPIDDPEPEPDETVAVTLAGGAGYTVGAPNHAVVTIADNDTIVEIVANDPAAWETAPGGGPPDPGEFTVTRRGLMTNDLTVTYLVGGTAANGGPNSDVAPMLTGTVIIPAGMASAPIPVTPVNDSMTEDDETVIATLQDGRGYRAGNQKTATVTIVDLNKEKSVDIDADIDRNGTVNGNVVEEAGEETIGTLVIRNFDNVYTDPGSDPRLDERARRREIVLRKLIGGAPFVRVARSSSNLLLFDTPTGVNEVFNGLPEVNLNVNQRYWLQGGTQASIRARDEWLMVRADELSPYEDTINVTVLWVDISGQNTGHIIDPPAYDAKPDAVRVFGHDELGVQRNRPGATQGELIVHHNINLVGSILPNNLSFSDKTLTTNFVQSTTLDDPAEAEFGFIFRRRVMTNHYRNGLTPVPPEDRNDDSLNQWQDVDPDKAGDNLLIVDFDGPSSTLDTVSQFYFLRRANFVQHVVFNFLDSTPERASLKLNWATHGDVALGIDNKPVFVRDMPNDGDQMNEVLVGAHIPLTHGLAVPSVTAVDTLLIPRNQDVVVKVTGTNLIGVFELQHPTLPTIPARLVQLPPTSPGGQFADATEAWVTFNTVLGPSDNQWRLVIRNAAGTSAAFPAAPLGGFQIIDGVTLSVNDPGRFVELGSNAITFTITVSGSRTGNIFVDAFTVGGTTAGMATSGVDFTPYSNRLLISPETSSVIISIPIIGDQDEEGDENLFFRLRNPSGAVIIDGDGLGTIADNDVPLTARSVSRFTSSRSDLTFDLDQVIDTAALNLYDAQGSGLGTPDVTVTGSTVGAVKGSLVADVTGTRFTFVPTGGPLLPDTYTVRLRSAANGFHTRTGALLDGNQDGLGGDDYVNVFTIAPSSAVVVSVPDFARGPGQTVLVPTTGVGLPLRLSNGSGVTSVTLTLLYNPALLTLTTATVGPTVPTGATASLNTSTPGSAVLTFSSPTPLPAGAIDFVNLAARVPDNAPYTAKHLLDLTDVRFNNGAIAAVDDDGLHVVSYFGDTTGNGAYSSADATRTLRNAVGLDSGFARHRLVDPTILADINGNGTINSVDAARILQEATGFDRPEIPPLPGVMPPIVFGGPDPLLNIPRTFAGRAGQTITVPVNLDLSDELEAVDLALAYDTSRLELVSADEVRRGSLTGDFDLFLANVDATAGTVRVGLGRTAGPISGRGSGSVLEITFRIKDDAPPGSALVNLLEELAPTTTQLNEGYLVLQPAPSNEAGDVLDGWIQVGEPKLAQVEQVTISPRSEAFTITVTFSTIVRFLGDPAEAFRLSGPGGQVPLNVAMSQDESGERTVVRLTLANPEASQFRVAEGRCKLSIDGDQVVDAFGQAVDGNGDGKPGGDVLDAFFMQLSGGKKR